MGMACLGVAASVVTWKAVGPAILINETPSEPRGFYRLMPRPVSVVRGMYVVFPVPAEVRDLVYGRHWMRNGIPFLKQVLGIAGDRVCLFPDRLEINERLIGPVFDVDSAGRPLPRRRGCFVVKDGDFFAASQHLEKSFDGRYFGPLPWSGVIGEARPLWTF